jgi:hypothetical protein
LRRLRIAAPTQLTLVIPGSAPTPAQRWFGLPDPAQAAVLVLLARMIARGVLVDEEVTGDDDRD